MSSDTRPGETPPSPPIGPPSPAAPSVAVAFARSLRPRQWVKNVLVFAVPVAAGDALRLDVLVPTLVAFVALCLASSATYLVNDSRDVESDRAHPTKQFRPQAAGHLSRATALVGSGALVVLALALAFSTTRALGLTVAAYLVLTLSYSLWLKREPVIELALLTAGFLLRAIAGGAATGIAISNWFLIVAGFGSLFMAVGKRYSELLHQGSSTSTRASLAGYSPEFLRWASGVSASVAITAYCVWAFEVAARSSSSLPWAQLSVIPFVLALMRYAVRIDAGDAEAPEEAVLGDRVLIGIAVAWALVFALGAYGA